jgi:hypothetical protein
MLQAKFHKISSHGEALEFARKAGFTIESVELEGWFGNLAGSEYDSADDGVELQSVGENWVYLNTPDGIKRCKPDGRSDSRRDPGYIVVTFSDN